jgi:sigma-B regulation protein RsbU (phosphoserine phosphatase)
LLVTDPLGRRVIAVDKPLLTLGRRSENDVCVSDVGVSRNHAEVVAGNGGYHVRDCGSRFGTFVNGERTSERPLRHGDLIRLGQSAKTEILFLVGDDAPSQARSAVAAASELHHVASLLEGLRALGSGRVLDDVLTLVLDAAIDVAGAERGFIMLANAQGRLELKLARARGRLTLPPGTFETSRKIPESVYASGRETVVEDLRDEGIVAQHLGTVALGIRHVLCAPLRIVRYVERADEKSEEKVIGVLYLDSREKGALLSITTRAALDTLGTEAAVAIENARLYREALESAKLEQELRVAATIQQSLLPAAGRAGAFFVTAGTSIPCRAVGGDFFDYIDLPSGRFGFILGDVAGKGSPAALLAAVVVGMFSAEAFYQESAASLVTRLNRGLLQRAVEARFLTAFYGMLAADGSLTYSNAGHNAPMLVTGGGVRRLETGGLVLGLFGHAIFEEETVVLQPGDTLIVFSDGVSEAFNEHGDEFGDDRLLGLIDVHKDEAPQALLDALLAGVRAFSGRATQSDDVTMLIVRFEGPAVPTP